MLTKESIVGLVPKKQQPLITDGLVDRINAIATDPLIATEFKENFVSYVSVMQQGKYSMDEYKNAVHFVTQKLLGNKDIDAYISVFPERYQRLLDNGVERNKMSPYVSAYRKNKLVAANGKWYTIACGNPQVPTDYKSVCLPLRNSFAGFLRTEIG